MSVPGASSQQPLLRRGSPHGGEKLASLRLRKRPEEQTRRVTPTAPAWEFANQRSRNSDLLLPASRLDRLLDPGEACQEHVPLPLPLPDDPDRGRRLAPRPCGQERQQQRSRASPPSDAATGGQGPSEASRGTPAGPTWGPTQPGGCSGRTPPAGDAREDVVVGGERQQDPAGNEPGVAEEKPRGPLPRNARVPVKVLSPVAGRKTREQRDARDTLGLPETARVGEQAGQGRGRERAGPRRR